MPCPFAHGPRDERPSPPPGPGAAPEGGAAWLGSAGPRLNGERIRELDPLHADAVLAHLPAMNRAGDVAALSQTLGALLPDGRALEAIVEDGDLACAAMRDLGMLSSSLVRHGADPHGLVPRLEPVLLRLGRASGLIPRDTVFHYGAWNPADLRQRMFTGHTDEHCLIECVRSSVPALDRAVAALEVLGGIAAGDGAFAESAHDCAAELEAMVEVIQLARERVSPVFFAQALRPYFEPLRVGGVTWQGPAAAHVPLFAVDHLLWASDEEDAELRALHDETSRYGLPRLRALYRDRLGRASILAAALDELPRLPAAVRASHAAALAAVFRPLVVFRGRHLAIANQAYAKEVRRFDTGSGGYAVTTLAHLLRLMRSASARLDEHARLPTFAPHDEADPRSLEPPETEDARHLH